MYEEREEPLFCSINGGNMFTMITVVYKLEAAIPCGLM